MLKGGETGPAIVPGEPAESLLIQAVNWTELEMPPKSKLPDGEIAILTRWVESGAVWPDEAPATEPQKAAFPLQQRIASHWSWRPVTDPARPTVADGNWPAADHDYFILNKLEAAKLAPAPPADRYTLIRRAYFDLIGLPPTPQQVNTFVDDARPTREAFATVVDELLRSPHFGERWARHWLDLVRYAESRGHEFDHNAANAYQYRDYVIRALNADVPYDQFIVEHLAGDLLSQPRLHPEQGFNESVLGTGFWYLGDWVHSPVDIRRDETDRIDNMIDTIGRAFLGLTIGCARCHDHKFDAITQDDYYALAGYVQSSQYRQVRFDSMEHNRQVAEKLWALRQKEHLAIRTGLAALLSESFESSAEYVDAALQVIREETTVADAADDDNLVESRIQAWVDQLRTAKQQVRHPLHAWALMAFDRNLDSVEQFAEFSRALAGRWKGELEKSDAALAAANIVVDYANIDDGFIQDGFAFGSRPVIPGDLRITYDGDGIHFGVFTNGAARRDELWRGLKLAGGTQGEPGSLGKMARPGQTLRTPTFTLGSGTIHYLVRGAGTVQAVVGSHRLIAGPLHGNLIRSFDTKGQLQWIGHGLDRYKGQRAHLEFAPVGDNDLEVLMVADSTSPPPMPSDINRTVANALSSGSPDAALFETVFLGTCNKMADGSIYKSATATDDARIADWLLGNIELFVDAGNKSLAAIMARTKEFHDEENKLAAQIQKESRTAISIWDGSGEDENLLIRGSSSNPGPLVPRRFLEALGGKDAPRPEHGSGRLELARQFVDAQRNPFIARVIVNRVWHHLFGRGIVSTVDNFGVLGQPPSHPELLDHLSARFVEQGWSIKRLIHDLMLSSTYQMSSKPDDDRAEQADPENILLHRMPVRRLEGEAIRDAILAISGRLDERLEGPSVPVYLTAFMTGRGRPGSGPLDGAGRRSIYTSIRRNFLPPMMLAFDMPIPFNPVGRRNVSNVPAQPLILMNDPFVVEQAKIWAERVFRDSELTAEQRIADMYESAFGRPPTEMETEEGLAFLQQQATAYGTGGDAWKTDRRVWADYGHVLWNVKEFIFID